MTSKSTAERARTDCGPCAVCKGEGWRYAGVDPGEAAGETVDCPRCEGSGREPCASIRRLTEAECSRMAEIAGRAGRGLLPHADENSTMLVLAVAITPDGSRATFSCVSNLPGCESASILVRVADVLTVVPK